MVVYRKGRVPEGVLLRGEKEILRQHAKGTGIHPSTGSTVRRPPATGAQVGESEASAISGGALKKVEHVKRDRRSMEELDEVGGVPRLKIHYQILTLSEMFDY